MHDLDKKCLRRDIWSVVWISKFNKGTMGYWGTTSRWLIKSPNLGNVSHKQRVIAETVRKCNGELRIKLTDIVVAVTLVAKQWEKYTETQVCANINIRIESQLDFEILMHYVDTIECFSVFSVVGVAAEHVSNSCCRSVTGVHILTLSLEYFANAIVPMRFLRDTWKLRWADVSGLCKKGLNGVKWRFL